MKNPKIVIAGIAVLVLLVVGGFLLTRKNSTTVKVTTPDGQGTMEVTTATGQMSISDLMNKGESVKCTYQATGTDFGSADTVLYVTTGKSRIETAVTDSQGQTRRSNTISDGQYIYVWSGEDGTGIKMPAEPTQPEDSSDAWQGQAQYADPNQKMDYQCEAWTVDESMFTPPANITFTDFGQVTNSQCAMCDNLQGDQRDACRQSLNCN